MDATSEYLLLAALVWTSAIACNPEPEVVTDTAYVGREHDFVVIDGPTGPEGDHVTWSVVARPATSEAEIDALSQLRARMVPDAPGNFVVEREIRIGTATDVTHRFELAAVEGGGDRPIANAGPDYFTFPDRVINIDGSASVDPRGLALSFRWRLLAVPEGSETTLSQTMMPRVSCQPDLPGVYVFELVVSNGFLESAPDTVEVRVHPLGD